MADGTGLVVLDTGAPTILELNEALLLDPLVRVLLYCVPDGLTLTELAAGVFPDFFEGREVPCFFRRFS